MFGAKGLYVLTACRLSYWVRQLNKHARPRVPFCWGHGQRQPILTPKQHLTSLLPRWNTRRRLQALNDLGETMVGLARHIKNRANGVKTATVGESHGPVNGELSAVALQALNQNAWNQIGVALNSNAWRQLRLKPLD